MTTLQKFRIVTWSVLGVVVAFLVVFGGIIPTNQVTDIQTMETSTPAIGKPFELTSHNGEVVNNAALAGKPYLAFFGFTHCPDICPTTLFELTDLMKELGPTSDDFNVVFITVDPERDTQEMLRLYMSSFDNRILALRGTADQTATAVKAFAAYSKKIPDETGGYTMDHTSGVYLMNADGTFRGTLNMHEPREVRLKKIQNLVGRTT